MTEYKKPENPDEAAMDIHEWLFKPQLGYAPRSTQLDGVMKVMRGGKFTSRVIIWAGGGMLALIGAWNTIATAAAKLGGGPTP